ncbi:hypothetical protein [Paeniglutamicibacter cryotolerans]|uniref:Lambda repressor-like predicted transcriptional regulator n=1 Tax=Paeniglutamicibacter cryotolerans TaxID=670079 RepID=A0A839QUA6_9MICC|nr:hypothetical protein [Paeniglutamicibacter cryotolerans]MBB2997546.1 lambda repressor-like predicted transcriptional regulator [Paeniglutamicibacter cryotolerans]
MKMPVDNQQVRQWLEATAPGVSISQLATQADISRITLHQQFRRGNVPELSLIAIARSLSLNPLEVLQEFSEYSDLVACEPDPVEVLAFIDWPELLQGVGKAYRGEKICEDSLGDVVFSDGSRVWVDAIDPGSLRKKVCDAEGLSSSNLASSLRGVLKVPLAITFARLAGTPLSSAFVTAGALSPEEAGWSANARSKALSARPIPELLTVVENRVTAANKFEKRVNAFKEGLG